MCALKYKASSFYLSFIVLLGNRGECLRAHSCRSSDLCREALFQFFAFVDDVRLNLIQVQTSNFIRKQKPKQQRNL